MKHKAKLIAVYMNSLFQSIFFITFLSLSMVCQPSQSCELVMGYQNKAKLPFINKAPDNSGIYLDIYSLAAQKIDCVLKVVRLPKVRTLNNIKVGEIDFYPGMKFSKERSLYIHFIPNGLITGRMGLSRRNMPLITNKQQLTNYSVLISLGGINYVDKIDGIKVHQVLNLGIEKAARMLILERADFYATDPIVVDNFLQNTDTTIFKKHPNCCGGVKPMHIGFSKNSVYSTEINNPDYRKGKNLSIENFPTKLVKDSIAYEFGKTVREVVKSYQYTQQAQ